MIAIASIFFHHYHFLPLLLLLPIIGSFVWVFEIIYSNSISASSLSNLLYSNGNFNIRRNVSSLRITPVSHLLHMNEWSIPVLFVFHFPFCCCLNSARFGLLLRMYRKFAQSECDEWIAFDRLPLSIEIRPYHRLEMKWDFKWNPIIGLCDDTMIPW